MSIAAETNPIAPATAIVQLYSQHELDVLQQKHTEQLRCMQKDHDELLKSTNAIHQLQVRRIKINHAIEIESARTTYCKGCREIENTLSPLVDCDYCFYPLVLVSIFLISTIWIHILVPHWSMFAFLPYELRLYCLVLVLGCIATALWIHVLVPRLVAKLKCR